MTCPYGTYPQLLGKSTTDMTCRSDICGATQIKLANGRCQNCAIYSHASADKMRCEQEECSDLTMYLDRSGTCTACVSFTPAQSTNYTPFTNAAPDNKSCEFRQCAAGSIIVPITPLATVTSPTLAHLTSGYAAWANA